MDERKIIVGISGASGALYGLRALEMIRAAGWQAHLVISRAGEMTLRDETGLTRADLESRCTELHAIGNVGATIASGSFRTEGMIVAPCSVKTMSEIATGVTSNLLSRAADVVLKERRRLVLMMRETPLHLGHLRTMTTLTEMGAIVAPPVPALYHKPQTIDDIVNHSVGRSLELLGLPVDIARWQGLGRTNAQDEKCFP